jgi:probable rRNA maturation factor
MYQIEFANSQDILEIDEAFLHEVARRTLAEEQVQTAEISVAVVDNSTIHELNRRYLAHDCATDVLSFLLECTAPAEPPDAPPSERRRGAGKRLEGEVVLSAEMAAETAASFGWSPHSELALYLVHGLLHLAGYDDLSDPERAIMRAREREILALWKLAPQDHDAR